MTVIQYIFVKIGLSGLCRWQILFEELSKFRLGVETGWHHYIFLKRDNLGCNETNYKI